MRQTRSAPWGAAHAAAAPVLAAASGARGVHPMHPTHPAPGGSWGSAWLPGIAPGCSLGSIQAAPRGACAQLSTCTPLPGAGRSWVCTIPPRQRQPYCRDGEQHPFCLQNPNHRAVHASASLLKQKNKGQQQITLSSTTQCTIKRPPGMPRDFKTGGTFNFWHHKHPLLCQSTKELLHK